MKEIYSTSGQPGDRRTIKQKIVEPSPTSHIMSEYVITAPPLGRQIDYRVFLEFEKAVTDFSPNGDAPRDVTAVRLSGFTPAHFKRTTLKALSLRLWPLGMFMGSRGVTSFPSILEECYAHWRIQHTQNRDKLMYLFEHPNPAVRLAAITHLAPAIRGAE
jgi:hypothetical protein